MNRQFVRMVAGANLVAGCLLLQGCGMFGKKPSDQGATTLPKGSRVRWLRSPWIFPPSRP